MLERLRSVGVDVDIADVRRASDGTAATGRPHVADALVALGVVPDRNEAFRLYLSPGRPAYVNRYAAPLVEMIRIVDEAGGVAVLAHPWGRHGADSMPESAITELAGLGWPASRSTTRTTRRATASCSARSQAGSTSS